MLLQLSMRYATPAAIALTHQSFYPATFPVLFLSYICIYVYLFIKIFKGNQYPYKNQYPYILADKLYFLQYILENISI